jgi:hypothetical protein
MTHHFGRLLKKVYDYYLLCMYIRIYIYMYIYVYIYVYGEMAMEGGGELSHIIFYDIPKKRLPIVVNLMWVIYRWFLRPGFARGGAAAHELRRKRKVESRKWLGCGVD